MEGYSLVYNKIKDTLLEQPFVNEVTEGLGDEIDLSKQTIFPLAHIVINNALPDGNHVTFQVTIYFTDIVDISDNGANNKHDVMNTQYNVALRLFELLRRGELWNDKMEVAGCSLATFEQAYENYLAGWTMELTILVPNHMTIC